MFVHHLRDVHEMFSSAIHEYALPDDNGNGRYTYYRLGIYVAFLSKEFNVRNLEFPQDDSIRKLEQFSLDFISRKIGKLHELLGITIQPKTVLDDLGGYVSEVFSDKRLERVIQITTGVRFPQLMDLSAERFPIPPQPAQMSADASAETITTMVQSSGSAQ
ncbi:hypothetical protein BDZ91DRAFT_148074 [Kalaharituber pfeilii]|nr:hypothetical protein BDZ91DRAFT_148074 [Kalaharituber pfeilii]